jgi:hypothetical protein
MQVTRFHSLCIDIYVGDCTASKLQMLPDVEMHLQRPDMHRRRRRRAPLRRQLPGPRDDRLILRAVLHAVVQVPHLVAAIHLHTRQACTWRLMGFAELCDRHGCMTSAL